MKNVEKKTITLIVVCRDKQKLGAQPRLEVGVLITLLY